MSKHVGEKCRKQADGDRTDGESDRDRTESRTETGRRVGRRPRRTSPYYNTSRLKTGILKKEIESFLDLNLYA